MTAGTVVITGGILASVILLLIIAVLCYCRLQVGHVCTYITGHKHTPGTTVLTGDPDLLRGRSEPEWDVQFQSICQMQQFKYIKSGGETGRYLKLFGVYLIGLVGMK